MQINHIEELKQCPFKEIAGIPTIKDSEEFMHYFVVLRKSQGTQDFSFLIPPGFDTSSMDETLRNSGLLVEKQLSAEDFNLPIYRAISDHPEYGIKQGMIMGAELPLNLRLTGHRGTVEPSFATFLKWPLDQRDKLLREEWGQRVHGHVNNFDPAGEATYEGFDYSTRFKKYIDQLILSLPSDFEEEGKQKNLLFTFHRTLDKTLTENTHFLPNLYNNTLGVLNQARNVLQLNNQEFWNQVDWQSFRHIIKTLSASPNGVLALGNNDIFDEIEFYHDGKKGLYRMRLNDRHLEGVKELIKEQEEMAIRHQELIRNLSVHFDKIYIPAQQTGHILGNQPGCPVLFHSTLQPGQTHAFDIITDHLIELFLEDIKGQTHG